MARKQRIDSATAAVDVMKAAARQIVPPASVKLKKEHLPFWDAVIAARPKSEWNDADLITAATLAKVLCLIEKQPDHELAAIDKLGRLALAIRRSLGLDVRGKDGRASDVANRRKQAFGIERDSPMEDDLIARPSIQ